MLNRLPRVKMSLLMLVFVPWTILVVTHLRVALLEEIPQVHPTDSREVWALSQALDAYASKYGEYPPDFTSGNPRKEIDEHLEQIFPDRDKKRDVPPGVDDLGPDNALAFWLRGFYQSNTQFPLTGKVYLGQHPVTEEDVLIDLTEDKVLAEVREGDSTSLLTAQGVIPLEGVQAERFRELLSNYDDLRTRQRDSLDVLLKRRPLYTFRPARLSQRWTYRPRCCAAPYVYFRAANYRHAEFADNAAWGVARPYRQITEEGSVMFFRPGTFQLLCAGKDSYFGSKSVTDLTMTVYGGHADNFTNFARRKPLGARQMLLWRDQAVATKHISWAVAIACLLLYPLVHALRQKRTGVRQLVKLTRNQLASLNCSASWRRELDLNRQNRRLDAIRRFETSGSSTDTPTRGK